MKFNLQDLNPGTKFFFDEDNEAEGYITLRILPNETRDEIRAKAVKKRAEYRKGQRYEIIDLDEDLFAEAVWDYSIQDWGGVYDESGAEIPCTRENKIMLMNKSPVFARIYEDRLKVLRELLEDHAKASEKN